VESIGGEIIFKIKKIFIMKKTTETIIMKSYDLLKHATPIINRLPKSQRFIFGDRLQNHLLDLLERLMEALYAPKHQKRELLQKVNLHLEKMRFLFRLGFDLHYFSNKQYADLIGKTDEIGRMTGGWIKSL